MMVKIDFHGRTVQEAKVYLLRRLRTLKRGEIYTLKLIHGYKGGQRLKSYFQSDVFLKFMEREGYDLKIILRFTMYGHNPGATEFSLYIPSYETTGAKPRRNTKVLLQKLKAGEKVFFNDYD